MTHHEPLSARTADYLWQLEFDLSELVRAELGMPELQAASLANSIMRGLRQRYGGMRLGRRGLYIPAPSKAERDAAIARAFDGRNAAALMRQHGISRSRLYQIVEKCRAKNPASSRETGRAGG